MRGFKEAMGEDFASVVSEIAVGMGPCGELRYPSYPGEPKGRRGRRLCGHHKHGHCSSPGLLMAWFLQVERAQRQTLECMYECQGPGYKDMLGMSFFPPPHLIAPSLW